MILLPAIDLKEGTCVRLARGAMESAVVFNLSPADQARRFREAGIEWLHVVDLDGAFAGTSVNGQAVEAILAALGPEVCVELGGGIRTLQAVEHWLERGVSRVVLGTVALREPALVIEACRRHPGRVAVGIDARNGRVAVEGWAKTADLAVLDLALKFEDAGVAALIYTDVDRDGILAGVNADASAALAERLTTPVIASGGVASLEDLRLLKRRAVPGVVGVIVGRAIYDGSVDLGEALSLLRDEKEG